MAEAKKAATKAATKSTKTQTKIDPILKELLESGAHFGHQKDRWNPKMSEYIFTERGGVHIIDLTKTAEELKAAQKAIEDITKSGKQVLFVATKRQAGSIVQKIASDAGMPWVTHRWLGGMLTNLDTINSRILRLKKLESQKQENDFGNLTKKEKAKLDEEIVKLSRIFDGVRDMYGVPGALFVVDMPREHIAIAEAHTLGIPVVAIADTNADPTLVEYPIAANDDAVRSIELITQKIADSAKTGAEAYSLKAASDAEAEVNSEKEVST